MLLHYVYANHNGSKQLVGCVCRTDEGRLGYSAVHPKDRRKMSRKLARKIALGRAEKCVVRYGDHTSHDIEWWGKVRVKSGYLMWENMTPVPAIIVPHLMALAEV